MKIPRDVVKCIFVRERSSKSRMSRLVLLYRSIYLSFSFFRKTMRPKRSYFLARDRISHLLFLADLSHKWIKFAFEVGGQARYGAQKEVILASNTLRYGPDSILVSVVVRARRKASLIYRRSIIGHDEIDISRLGFSIIVPHKRWI